MAVSIASHFAGPVGLGAWGGGRGLLPVLIGTE